MTYDLVIRGGTIIDGTGAPPRAADVGISAGVIARIDRGLGPGAREVDATGLIVTPGFVDLHTHYDGQAIWSDRMTPSSAHGVTTVVMGNCGVGFAPCRAEDHEVLVDVMSGVEDIPGVVMTDGLPWTWETFPEYLDALEANRRDIDVAALLPHSPLRVYVMGSRGVDREPATTDDLARMRELAAQAIRAGALGFASSRLNVHRTGGGDQIPSFQAGRAELAAIAAGVADAGGGLLQFVPDVPSGGYAPVLEMVFDVAGDAGLPVTFTLLAGNAGAPVWPEAMDLVAKYNAAGSHITAQVFPRPIGLVIGLELTANPFVLHPSYQAIAHWPLPERVAEMRKPEVRQRILSERPGAGHPLMQMARNWEWIFPLGSPPNYEPDRSSSILARAQAKGIKPKEEAYERLLDDDGHAMLLGAMGNFQDNSLDVVGELMRRDDVVLGLGDGGAHYGMVCDASYSTFMLTHWTRDRPTGRISVEQAVKDLTSIPAALVGLHDRGRLAEGYKADLNVIDHAALSLERPVIVNDLPGNGRRLDQRARGYRATVVAGEMIAENGVPTAARPGALVRGRRHPPA